MQDWARISGAEAPHEGSARQPFTQCIGSGHLAKRRYEALLCAPFPFDDAAMIGGSSRARICGQNRVEGATDSRLAVAAKLTTRFCHNSCGWFARPSWPLTAL